MFVRYSSKSAYNVISNDYITITGLFVFNNVASRKVDLNTTRILVINVVDVVHWYRNHQL